MGRVKGESSDLLRYHVDGVSVCIIVLHVKIRRCSCTRKILTYRGHPVKLCSVSYVVIGMESHRAKELLMWSTRPGNWGNAPYACERPYESQFFMPGHVRFHYEIIETACKS